MIPSFKTFGDITFSDLSWPEDRRRRAEDLLETFQFREPADAYAILRSGCWRRLTSDHLVPAMPYQLATYCANHKIDTRAIAIQSWNELYVNGSTQEEAAQRAADLKWYLDEDVERRKDNVDHYALFTDYRLFEAYDEYYAGANYQNWEEIFLVFAVPEIMDHVQQHEISPVGWALWKYAINENMLFGFHPMWSFERPREHFSSMTQGSGYEYLVRVVGDGMARGHAKMCHPAFMFLNQDDALKFRTMLDMLGFYDQESRKYETLKPVPIFAQTVSGTAHRSNIRSANFMVM